MTPETSLCNMTDDICLTTHDIRWHTSHDTRDLSKQQDSWHSCCSPQGLVHSHLAVWALATASASTTSRVMCASRVSGRVLPQHACWWAMHDDMMRYHIMRSSSQPIVSIYSGVWTRDLSTVQSIPSQNTSSVSTGIFTYWINCTVILNLECGCITVFDTSSIWNHLRATQYDLFCAEIVLKNISSEKTDNVLTLWGCPVKTCRPQTTMKVTCERP